MKLSNWFKPATDHPIDNDPSRALEYDTQVQILASEDICMC